MNQVNAAQQGRRRTYRAHGRIGPYMSSPQTDPGLLTGVCRQRPMMQLWDIVGMIFVNEQLLEGKPEAVRPV